MDRSVIGDRYDRPIDRDSAFEMLKRRAEQAAAEAAAAEEAARAEREYEEAYRADRSRRREPAPRRRRSAPESVGAALGQAVLRELGGTTGRRLVRGILGGLFRGR